MEAAVIGIPVVLIVGAFVAIGIALYRQFRRRHTERLGGVADLLAGSFDVGRGTASGKAFGPRIELRYTNRGSGSNSDPWTEIDVDLPPGHALALYVRRHESGDRKAIDRGAMVDVQVGDAAFDAEFLVEAAPADVARRLLDPSVRGFLSRQYPVELTTETVDGRPVLRWASRPWIDDRFALRPVFIALAQLAARVRDAYAAADAAVAPVEAGMPYRPVLDDQPARDARVARADEVATVRALREQRQAHDRAIGAVVVGLVVGVPILYAVAANGC